MVYRVLIHDQQSVADNYFIFIIDMHDSRDTDDTEQIRIK